MKKKLFLLLLLPFLLAGCYDYQELNNLAIISGIAIDYIDQKFIVTYEVLNSKKSEGSDEGSSSKAYYVEGKGNTVQEAFVDANLGISKEPYFSHVKVMLFSEEVAEEKMDAIIDFIIRNPNIRNIFVPILAIGTHAQEVLKTPTTENPVTSEAIRNMIEMSKSYENIAIKQDFETFVSLLIDKRKDAYINTVEKKDDAISLTGIGAFRKNKLVTLLEKEDSGIFNVLNNTSYNHYVTLACPKEKDKYTIIDLYDNQNTEIEVKDNTIEIKSNLVANIISDECHYDFRETKTYEELENRFYKEVENEFRDVLQTLRTYKSDLLGINDLYYKKNRKDLTNWYEYNMTFQVYIDINKNGLIFQVTNNE